MCQVIDKTPEYLSKNKSSYSATESRVHSLGYNVIKQGYNYSFEQRKIILANIIENYGISQHEILSMIDAILQEKLICLIMEKQLKSGSKIVNLLRIINMAIVLKSLLTKLLLGNENRRVAI